MSKAIVIFIFTTFMLSAAPVCADGFVLQEAMKTFGYAVVKGDFISYYFYQPVRPTEYSEDIGEEKIESLLREVRKLKPETIVDVVREKLGNPSFDQMNFTKSGDPGFIDRTLTYNMRIVDVGVVNMRDQSVVLRFNKENKLTTISIFNSKYGRRE